MTNFKYGVVGVAGLALLLCVASVSAQQSAPVRVRGEIEKVDGNKLTVKTREGATVNVVLKDGAVIGGVDTAKLSDVKQNSFVGITAMPQPDGTQKAIEVHIFPESRRGAGEGHRPWDLVPNSTMTNANVEQLVTSVDGPMLTMKYKDGEKKIMVPNNATIVQFVSAEKSDLKPGAKIFVVAGTKLPNGDIETAASTSARTGSPRRCESPHSSSRFSLNRDRRVSLCSPSPFRGEGTKPSSSSVWPREFMRRT